MKCRGVHNPPLKKVGLPDMRPYDLRHSSATLWLESGESAETQKILGHWSITTTVDRYSQISPATCATPSGVSGVPSGASGVKSRVNRRKGKCSG